jgi:cysteinyl-tRNA synthetase
LSALKIYDSLSRTLVDFSPRDPGKVGIYACGLTPQAPAHIGHMRGAVLFDVIRKWLRHLGYNVDFVQNFTDIDDKIIRRAQEEGTSPEEVARKYGLMYFDDLEALGVEPARWVYVTQNIPKIVEMIETIIERGHAYTVDGDVYFRVSSLPQYGKLSRRKISEMQAGARIEVDERKEHPMDFALWKSAKPGEPSWDSPWGKGRPGWHIECSALSLNELGPNFDIHAGGVDLVFPHHENEIAQSEAYLGKEEFARIWMHWGAVRMAGDKMSKSVGNVLAVREAIAKYSAGAVRLLLLGTDYRSPIEYSDERMAEAQAGFNRIQTALARARQMFGSASDGEIDSSYMERFAAAMNHDFNTAAATAVLYEVVRELNELMANGVENRGSRAVSLIRTADEFTGLLGLSTEHKVMETDQTESRLMELLIGLRKELRQAKMFELADKIREDLKNIGIQLEDSVEGTTWRRS